MNIYLDNLKNETISCKNFTFEGKSKKEGEKQEKTEEQLLQI